MRSIVFILTIVQLQSICSPSGNECYNNLPISNHSCITPCHGLYADVQHEEGVGYAGEGTKQFRQALAEYQLYKDGGEVGLKYPVTLTSK